MHLSYYTTQQAARRLGGITRQRVYQLQSEGLLAGVQDREHKWKWDRESVDELAAARELARVPPAQRAERQRHVEAQTWELQRKLAVEQAQQDRRAAERDELARRFVLAIESIAQCVALVVERVAPAKPNRFTGRTE